MDWFLDVIFIVFSAAIAGREVSLKRYDRATFAALICIAIAVS